MFLSGSRCEGEFRDGVLQGRGTLELPDGSSYEGDLVRGQRHGKGESYGMVAQTNSKDKSAGT